MNHRVAKWIAGATVLGILVSVTGCGVGTNHGSASGSDVRNTNSGGTGTAATSGASSTGNVTLNETGSSLLYPLFNGEWVPAYKTVHPNVAMNSASTGSGAGISQAIAGTVQIGASDAYMADAQMAANPSMVNIPLAISAQQVMYNLPGIAASQHLHLTGDVLAKIYMGKIAYWDDSSITALNPGIRLPHQPITVIRRSDGSGDTFLFTQFLSDTNATWKANPGYGTSVTWPSVSTEIGGQGNSGVVQALINNKYSIGYVGISWLDKAVAQGIGYAALQNQAGKFVLPTPETIQAAANAMTSKVPADERISLIYAPGSHSYPIINFEYAVVNTNQPSSDIANAMKQFLSWSIDPIGGNSTQDMAAVHFLPLPASIQPKSEAQINKING